MKKPYVGRGVSFPKGVVFVRPTTDTEREHFLSGNTQELFYTVVDQDGDPLTIVSGSFYFAFNAARVNGREPVWMH